MTRVLSGKENAQVIVSKALREVLEEEKINWGDYQEGKVVHLGRIDAFSEPLPEVNGYADAPNAFKGFEWSFMANGCRIRR